MRCSPKIALVVSVTLILMILPIFSLTGIIGNGLTESEAISLLKAAYPEFNNYPNQNLPPQSIQTRQASNGWYVAFVQEGSGRPILEAKCFLVGNDKTIATVGVYSPKVSEDPTEDSSWAKIFNLWTNQTDPAAAAGKR